jgi:hypothetical protein
MNVACCLTVRNSAFYLPAIFKNLNLLSGIFENDKFNVIFVYDNCDDETEEYLNDYKTTSTFKVFVVNIQNKSNYRTVRIANARNTCLDIVYNVIKNIDYHFMIDADDVNVSSWDLNLIKYYLDRDEWDSISFNRPEYYDIWALQYDNFRHHCWGFGSKSASIVECVKQDITTKLNSLKKYELFECSSAFNGFAIYRTPKFYNICYNGLYKNMKTLITDAERFKTVLFLNTKFQLNLTNLSINNYHKECCEHLYYHLSAIKNNNVRIRISRENLFL